MEIIVLQNKFGISNSLSVIVGIILLSLLINQLTESALMAMFAMILMVLTFAFYVVFNNQRSELHLTLDHAQNQLAVQSIQNSYELYSILASSRANFLGVWLYLGDCVSQAEHESVTKAHGRARTKIFIARWQLDKRGISALNRHLIWYAN